VEKNIIKVKTINSTLFNRHYGVNFLETGFQKSILKSYFKTSILEIGSKI